MAGATAYGASQQASAAKKAAKIGGRAADAGVEEQRRQFDTSLQLTAPQRQVGNSATNALARMLGLPQFTPASAAAENFGRGLDANGNSLTSLVGDTDLPIAGRTIVPRAGSRTTFDVLYNGQDVGDLVRGGPNGRFIGGGAPIPQPMAPEQPAAGAAGAGTDPNADFFASPDYQFRRDEGGRDIQQQFAARGGAQSGNALRALSEFNSNLASGEFGNRFNRLAALAGIGQTANAQGATNAINTGRGVAAGLQDAGSARASGVLGSGQAGADLAAGLAGTIPLFQDALAKRKKNALGRMRGGYGDQYDTSGYSDG